MEHIALQKFYFTLTSSLRREEGQALAEYSIVLLLVVIVAIGASTSLGQSVVDLLQKAINTLVHPGGNRPIVGGVM